MLMGIDCETYCEVSIKDVGLDNYVSHPSFQVLMFSVVEGDSYHFPTTTTTYDFVCGGAEEKRRFRTRMMSVPRSTQVVAHNADFERRVLATLGVLPSGLTILDSAVIARCQGADSALANAAPQLLNLMKLDGDGSLVKEFCMGPTPPTSSVCVTGRWHEFVQYCETDAMRAFQIASAHVASHSTERERVFERVTSNMNMRGMNVDLDSVRLMQQRFEDNKVKALSQFRQQHDPKGELNLNSLKQLKEWCDKRHIKASSFDEAHVQKLIDSLESRLTATPGHPYADDYWAVVDMLKTKQVVGGSSLKKLQKILDLTGPDGRLRHQYMHCGAGSTYRTSSKGVQLQNLKRMGALLLDMDDLINPMISLTNDDLAANLRQVFTATDPAGTLIVGDFASVESRGLAWLAGQDDKIDLFRKKGDPYKVFATKFYGVDIRDITTAQRKLGKVAELGCGYGAGGPAVAAQAVTMGVQLTDQVGSELVSVWRDNNPRIVELWAMLQAALETVVSGSAAHYRVQMGHGLTAVFHRAAVPQSLLDQHPGARSIMMSVEHGGDRVFDRIFHGCYMRGRSVCFYKPSSLKGGKAWSASFVDPKTKQRKYYSLYGGKLAGILTQSFCREIFFDVLLELERWLGPTPHQIVHQFHDEIVVDYKPGPTAGPLTDVVLGMKLQMSTPPWFCKDFPLEAEVHWNYRYTK